MLPYYTLTVERVPKEAFINLLLLYVYSMLVAGPPSRTLYLGNDVQNETLDRNALPQEHADGHRRVEMRAGSFRHDVPVDPNGKTIYIYS